MVGVSQSSFKKNTIKAYQSILSKLTAQFGERNLISLTPEEVLSFLTQINQGTKQLTKRTRYSQLTSFFNFVTQNLDSNFRSPCDTPMLKKLYRPPGPIRWAILEKELVDEIIFRTIKPRNRLILELMARGGMRIGEVLKLTPNDIEDRKLTLRTPVDILPILPQLPQLSGYFDRNLLILRNPNKKVVTTNYVLQTSLVDSI